MPFSELRGQHNFVISFTDSPQEDFGIFARGYYEAAKQLADTLLAGPPRGDNHYYPVIFLYRHAFELYLKNIIYKSIPLYMFKNLPNVDTRLYTTHRLDVLAGRASQILQRLFPDYEDVQQVAMNIIVFADEFSRIDTNSYSYRYPIDNRGNYSTSPHQMLGLESVYEQMNPLLDQLEYVDFGFDVEIDFASQVYDILVDLEEDFSCLEEE